MNKEIIKNILMAVFILLVASVATNVQQISYQSGSTLSGQYLSGLMVANSSNSTGGMYVITDPAGANIYLNNVFRGISPISISGIGEGNWSIKVMKTGYYDGDDSVSIRAGVTANVSIALVKMQVQNNTNQSMQTGALYVIATPSDVQIYVNDIYKGIAPLTISNLYVGNYTVAGTKERYNVETTGVHISAGTTTNLSLALIPLGISNYTNATNQTNANITIASTSKNTQINFTGGIRVITDTIGAEVYINTNYMGMTPVTVSGLNAGNYTITLLKKGYYDEITGTHVSAGQITNLSVTLRLANQTYFNETGNQTSKTGPSVSIIDAIINFFRSLFRR